MEQLLPNTSAVIDTLGQQAAARADHIAPSRSAPLSDITLVLSLSKALRSAIGGACKRCLVRITRIQCKCGPAGLEACMFCSASSSQHHASGTTTRAGQ